MVDTLEETAVEINPFIDPSSKFESRVEYFHSNYMGKTAFSRESNHYLGMVRGFNRTHLILDVGMLHLDGLKYNKFYFI